MARMIPTTIDDTTASRAERLLFDGLREQLPDDYTVLHAVAWTRRTRGYPDSDGEADFVIIHPTRGLLVLEVKGGRIRVDGETGAWFSTDRGGDAHPIKNPFEQAKRNRYSLVELLKDSPQVGGASFYHTFGVAFPDVRIDGHPFGVGIPRAMWLDSTDLSNLEAAVRGMYGDPGNQRSLSSQEVAAIVDMIRPTREITRLGLAAAVRHGNREVTELTERQYELLRFLQHHPRARIEGCAGSGKTMLAVEKARRLAVQGFDVLLTCYNRGLAAWLRRRMAEDDRPEFARVTVQHYHDLAMTTCERAGMPQEVPGGDAAARFWETDLPQAFMTALQILPEHRYDAIIVDEGQDFATDWWVTLEELLRDPDAGVFYIFHDDNQRLYRRSGDMPVPAAPFALDSNCRNTKQIHEAVMRYYHETPKPAAGGPDGRQIQQVSVVRDDANTVRKLLVELIDGEGLRADQIAVLTPRSASRSTLADGLQLGHRTLAWRYDTDPNTIRVSSIHGFKGLERDVIILAETDEFRNSRAPIDMLCYVALSRAKHHVIVIGDLPDPVLNTDAPQEQVG